MAENLTLDLHQVRHEEAEILVDRFINENWGKNLYFQIITGNSEIMKNFPLFLDGRKKKKSMLNM